MTSSTEKEWFNSLWPRTMKASSSVQYWRVLTFGSIFFGWALYMLVRRTLPSSMQILLQNSVFTKDSLGLIASSFSLSYGVSKLVFSFVSDHVSPRLLFVSGLLCTGLCCLLFPLCSGVTMLACVVWGLAGVVQGCGWAPCVILLKAWYTPSQIGTWWSVLSAAGNFASILSPFLMLYITSFGDWRLSYWAIGLFTLAFSCIFTYTIKNSPQEIGLQNNSKQTMLVSSNVSASGSKWYSVFTILELWVVGTFYSCLSIVKDGVAVWMAVFLVEVGQRSLTVAAASVSVFQAGGMTGNLVTGYISDLLLVKSARLCPRAPLLLLASLLMVAALHTYRTSAGEEVPELLWSAVVFSVGFLADGMMTIIGLSGMEMAPRHLASSAHGFVAAYAQVGCVLAGWPFAYVMQHYNWNIAYCIVELVSVAMVMMSVYLVVVMVRSIKQEQIKKD